MMCRPLTPYLLFISLCYLAYAQQSQYFEFEEVRGGLSNSWISCVMQDKQGFLWLGSQDGLNRYDGYTFEILRNIPGEANSLPANFVTTMLLDEKDNLWIGTQGGGISKFTASGMRFEKFNQNEVGKFIYKLYPLEKKGMVVLSDDGIFIFEFATGKVSKLSIGNPFNTIATQGDSIWIAEKNELYHYDLRTGLLSKSHFFEKKIRFLFALPNQQLLISFEKEIVVLSKGKIAKRLAANQALISAAIKNPNEVYLAADSQLLFYDVKKMEFLPINTTTTFSGNHIQTVFTDRNGLLWIGTQKGLYKESQKNKAFEGSWFSHHARRILHFDAKTYVGGNEGLFIMTDKNKTKHVLADKDILSIHVFDDKIWTGDNLGKLYLLDKDLKEKEIPLVFKGQGTTRVLGIDHDLQNRIWVGTWSGLYVLDKLGNILNFYSLPIENQEFETKTIQILRDRQDRLWIATAAYGVFMIPSVSEVDHLASLPKIYRYNYNEQNDNSLTTDIVLTIEEDRNGKIWFGTDVGVVSYKEDLNEFDRLKFQNKLFDKKVMTVRSDGLNRLWITTIHDGIYVYDQQNEVFYHHNKSEGLISDNFLFTSGFYDSKANKMYFGTDEGIQTIDLSKYKLKPNERAPSITSFVIHDGRPKNSLSPFQIPYKSQLKLNPDQNDFDISFSSLEATNPENIKYAYTFDDEEWKVTDLQTAYFTNIPYGHHQLRVKTLTDAGNLEDFSPTTVIAIYIRPPWYLRWWAYGLYILLFFAALYGIYFLLLKRKLALAEAESTKELDAVKSKMYANISHEFRTPLTLIGGFANKLIRNTNLRASEIEDVEGIKQSNNRLLNLVDQMLDLVSLDGKQMQANYKKGDMVGFVNKCVMLYKSYSDSKEQRLQFNSEINELIMDIDDDKIQKILNNLLSNAIKFTPRNGTVKVQLLRNGQNILLKVSDTGKGIPADELPYLYDRYYKTFDLDHNLGSGIGMALTQELVTLLNGSISVQSEAGKGSCFSISLPITHTITTDTELVYAQAFVEKSIAQTFIANEQPMSGQQTILVVEDNLDVRNYLADLLSPSYKIISAEDGVEGLKIAKKKTIDFLLCDLMMPRMDGFEFCKKIKDDVQTSHIPFIMLTANTEHSNKLIGYKLGVDAYLTKPFHEQELLVIIENLLQKRKQQIDYFSTLLELKKPQTKETDIRQLDVNFIKDIQEIALQKAELPPVETIARNLLLSRSQLHRKIKVLTGMSITNYINHVRIEKSKELLTGTSLTISEISYELGYDNVSYFSKLFKKQTGVSPSSYREKA